METVRLASAQWPMALRPEHPLAPASADLRPIGLPGARHQASFVGTQLGKRAATGSGLSWEGLTREHWGWRVGE